MEINVRFHDPAVLAKLDEAITLLKQVLVMDARSAAALVAIDNSTSKIASELSALADKLKNGDDPTEVATALEQRASALASIASANDPDTTVAEVAKQAATQVAGGVPGPR